MSDGHGDGGDVVAVAGDWSLVAGCCWCCRLLLAVLLVSLALLVLLVLLALLAMLVLLGLLGFLDVGWLLDVASCRLVLAAGCLLVAAGCLVVAAGVQWFASGCWLASGLLLATAHWSGCHRAGLWPEALPIPSLGGTPNSKH